MKIVSRTLLSAVTILTTATAIYAQSMTAEQVLQSLDNNLLLQQMQTNAKADLLDGKAANTLGGPEAEYEHLWGKDGAHKWNVGLTQSFDWPGLYSARRQAYNAEYTASELERTAQYAETVVEVKRLLVQSGFICQRREIINSMITDLTDLQKYLDEALQHGLVTIIDHKKAAIEIVNLQIERDALNEQLAAVIGQISSLTGTEFDVDKIDVTSMPALGSLLSLDDYLAKEDVDPMVVYAAAAWVATKANEKVVDRSVLPGFGIGYRHAFEENTHFDGFAVSISLPTWDSSKAKQSSRMKTMAAETGLALQKQLYRTRVKTEYNAAATLRERIKSLRAVGMDGSYLQLLKMAREGGEISMLDYLREQSYYRTTALSLLDLEERYALLLTSLNR